jgi:hypothetical protein
MKPETAIDLVIGTRSIGGWFNQGAAYLFALLDEIQKQEEIVGDIFEIGVHHGKSTILLGKMVDPARERLGICDVFEQESKNVSISGAGNRTIFERNMQRFFDALGFMHIHAKSSLELAVGDIGTEHRFFHIDGGHDPEEVYSDLGLAAEATLPEGLIIMDDVFSPLWPGVAEGLFHFMSDSPGLLAPVVIGFNKLVLTPPQSTARYMEHLEDRSLFDRFLAPMPFSIVPRTFLGHTVLIIHTTPWAVTDSLKARLYRFMKRHPLLANRRLRSLLRELRAR